MDEPISKELFDVLACPIDKSDLKYNPDKTALVCKKCGKEYKIEDGIPNMLPS